MPCRSKWRWTASRPSFVESAPATAASTAERCAVTSLQKTAGYSIEGELGGGVDNFPTIDKFENGVATSIKSIDLEGKTYQNMARLSSKLKGYIDHVADFGGASANGRIITAGDIDGRALELAVQPGAATGEQSEILKQVAGYESKGRRVDGGGSTVRIRKLANVDLRHDEYIVYSFSQTEDRFWIANGWMTRLPATATDVELGDAVRSAFDASRQGLPTPPAGDRPFDFALKILGVKSFAAYAADTRSVTVESDITEHETIIVTPNKRVSEGFVPVQEHETEHQDGSSAALGAAVNAAVAVTA